MDESQKAMLALLETLSGQMRGNLSTLHLVTRDLISEKMREADPLVDKKAAMLDQSFYQLLRLAENLGDSEYITQTHPLLCQLTDVVSLVGDVCAKSQSAIWDTGKTVRFHCPVSTLSWGVNRRGLERVLYHLISNALKYSQDGQTVTLSVQEQGNHLEIIVADTGCGMTSAQLEKAMELGNDARIYTDLKRGFGMGLPIANAIVKRHGGTLTLKSQPGEGTSAIISLPKAEKAFLGFSDVPFGYGSSFNPTLVRLADALPSQAFGVREQDG